ncbi:MAG: hypothetical protein Q4B99_06535 [Clostridia bacterium]|nr:hypothetical protein [Clostridia bacterium]
MKKLLALLLALMCIVPLAGCNKQEHNNYELSRLYVHQESEDIIKPSIKLLEGNKCQFTFSALRSYLGLGTYTIEDSVLVIDTDDGEYKYTFHIDGENIDKLIFDAGNSSEYIHYGEFEDGAVFELVANSSIE